VQAAAINRPAENGDADPGAGRRAGRSAAGGVASARATAGVVFPRTKFHRPPARAEHVERTALLASLDAAGGGPDGPVRLLLVSAPPGFGKSTLLAQWATRRPRTAWVSLDADDRGGRLWAAVLTALQPLLGDALDPALEAAAATDADLRDAVLVALLDALDGCEEAVTLVLDDVHLVLDDARTRASLDWLLGRLPAPHAVALGSRRAPELPALGRLRSHGELLDVRTDELRFSLEEARGFLRDRLRLELDDDAIAALERRVEGWPAATYLAALRLRRGDAVEEVLGALGGGDEELFGGLADEVLASWPAAHRRFVLETSVLERFTADLCVRTIGSDDPDEDLRSFRELTRTSLLLIPLDRSRTWFRCHHLLRDVLRQRLEEEEPGRARQLHVRAGAWLESEGGESELYEAVEHYLAAREWDLAAELLARQSLRLVGFGVLGERAGRWLGRFPPAVVAGDARLAYVSALVAAVAGDREGCDVWLAAGAEAGWSGPMPDGTASFALAAEALRAMVCFDDLGAASAAADRVLDELPRAAPARSAVAAMESWHALLRGDRGRAERLAGEALAAQELLPTAGLPLVATLSRAVLGMAALDRGAVEEARGHVDQAEEHRRSGPLRRAPHALPAVCAAARLDRIDGRPERAIERCRQAIERAAGWRDSSLMVPAALVELARACRDAGDGAGAATAAEAADARLRDAADAGSLPDAVAALRDRGARRRLAGEPESLSDREAEVLRALAGTGSLREIADGLVLSRNTVKTHTRTLYAKLGVASRQQAVRRGHELGLLGRRSTIPQSQEDRP